MRQNVSAWRWCHNSLEMAPPVAELDKCTGSTGSTGCTGRRAVAEGGGLGNFYLRTPMM